MRQIAIWILVLPVAHGFIRPRGGAQPPRTPASAALGLPEGMEMPEATGVFAEPGWPDLKVELNRVPTWCIVQADGAPAKEASGATLFFVDVDEALSRRASLGIERLKKGGESDGLDIIPVPLGDAFTLAAGDIKVLRKKKSNPLQALSYAVSNHTPLET